MDYCECPQQKALYIVGKECVCLKCCKVAQKEDEIEAQLISDQHSSFGNV